LTGSFDRVFSAGMFEHVGYKNYRRFFETVRRVLKDDGLFLLHTIGGNETLKAVDPWIDKYIFPNCLMPSCRQIADATEDLFVMEDWHNFGVDYDKTLVAWFENFDRMRYANRGSVAGHVEPLRPKMIFATQPKSPRGRA
jgi:cyclopropane-fatty-acyl-phospholipid synthase